MAKCGKLGRLSIANQLKVTIEVENKPNRINKLREYSLWKEPSVFVWESVFDQLKAVVFLTLKGVEQFLTIVIINSTNTINNLKKIRFSFMKVSKYEFNG